MNTLLQYGVLLAASSHLDSLSSGFRGRRTHIEPKDYATGVLVLTALVLVVWFLSYMMTLQERRKTYRSPGRLFLALCREHRLRWPQRWLLWRAARAQRLRNPAQIFLEPERFEPAKLGPSLRARQDEFQRLRDKLFVDLDES